MNVMRVAAFVVGSGFLSLLVVPVLAVLVATFGLSAIVVPGVGVLQVLGLISESHGVTYWGKPVPTGWVLPLTLAISVVSAAIAWGAQRLLTRYAAAVLAGYRRLRPAPVQ